MQDLLYLCYWQACWFGDYYSHIHSSAGKKPQ